MRNIPILHNPVNLSLEIKFLTDRSCKKENCYFSTLIRRILTFFQEFYLRVLIEERMKYEVHIGLKIHVKDGTNGNPEKLDAFDEEGNNE